MTVTERQREILNFIRRFQAREGYGPAIREICTALGLASPGSLIKHLRALETEGHLTRTLGKKRTWKLTGRLSAPSIPILGQVTAGAPILAQENQGGDLPMDPAFFGCEVSFALRIKGDSMIEVHIQNGDLAVIRPQGEADNGQIVAVLVEGLEPEATLKILRRKRGRVELWPANSRYEPLVFVGSERSRIKILGKLAGVIRAGA